MKYTIGYQLPKNGDSIPAIVHDYQAAIAGVYFAPPGEVSGRTPLEAQSAPILRRELDEISAMGVPLTMLLNASCYGGEATAVTLRDRVCRNLDAYPTVQSVTVCSPAVARFVKAYRPDVKVTASVNLRVGSIAAMAQLSEWFDGYYMKREWNRDFSAIEKLSSWAKQHGKALYLLANSGCLYDCAFQTFHDNLVAHEKEALQTASAATGRAAPCRDYLAQTDAPTAFLRGTWIRPEDISRYDSFFSVAKLATRMHDFPRKVVHAYVKGHYRGNLLDLTEPSLSSFCAGTVLDATRMPSNWATQTTACGHQCETCTYCETVAKAISVRYTPINPYR